MKLQHFQHIYKGAFFQLLATISVNFVAVSDGMQFAWSAPLIPALKSMNEITITPTEETCLQTIYLIGSLIMIPITVYLIDKIGRHRSIQIASIISLIGWGIIALSFRVMYLALARLLMGVASNIIFVAIPMYVTEITEPKFRGFATSFTYIQLVFGILVVYSAAPFVPLYVPSLIGGGLVAVQIVAFAFMPQSPYYLLLKGEKAKALKALNQLRGGGDNDAEFLEFCQMAEGHDNQKSTFCDFVRSDQKTIVIIFILMVMQNSCGYTVVLMNIHSILAATGSVYISPNSTAIICSFIMLLSVILSTFLVDSCGRRILLMTSCVLLGLSQITLAVFLHLKMHNYRVANVSWVPIVSFVVFTGSYNFGLGCIPKIIASEMFSMKVKALGITLSNAIYIVFECLALVFYQHVSSIFGFHIPFYTFSVVAFSAAIFTYFIIPETKGKSLEEIQRMIKGRNGLAL